MSAEPLVRSRRVSRRVLILLAAAIVAAAIAAWMFLPRSLGVVRVEDARAVPGGMAVTFATPSDLDALRTRSGMAYVAARLASCDEPDLHVSEVAAQDDGPLVDRRRVRRLPSGADGQSRYQVTFDDQLAREIDQVTQRRPARAAPGGLCFSLHAARMWFGHARSDTAPLTVR